MLSQIPHFTLEATVTVFSAERLGSGDGEGKTWLTRQIAFEPLPASILFALVGCGIGHGWLAATKSAKLGAEAIAADMMGAAVSGKVNP
jgi:hypothetical protein